MLIASSPLQLINDAIQLVEAGLDLGTLAIDKRERVPGATAVRAGVVCLPFQPIAVM
jgi:hypothetical protein